MNKAMPMVGQAEERDWKAESDLRTMIEAEKVRRDPERMKAAMEKRKELIEAASAIKEKANG